MAIANGRESTRMGNLLSPRRHPTLLKLPPSRGRYGGRDGGLDDSSQGLRRRPRRNIIASPIMANNSVLGSGTVKFQASA